MLLLDDWLTIPQWTISHWMFRDSVVRMPYSRGFSNNDLSIIAGKAAEVLLSTFKKVGQNLGKLKQVDTTNNILNCAQTIPILLF